MICLDLFSGIGGFAEGFRRAGFEFSKHYFSEIDKHAIAVYKHQFPNAELLHDVTTIYDRTIERPNLVTFGFPCQDLSVAGKGKGLDGTRSGLFFEAVRLIEKHKPEIFIFENVKGLLSSNEGKDFETVLRTIADLGIYDCEWQLVNTSWVLPQNRERVYFIGHLRGSSTPKVFPFRETDTEFTERSTNTATVRAICGGGHSGGHHSGMTLVGNIYPSKGENGNIYSTIGISPTLKSGETSTKGNGGIGSCNAPKIQIKSATKSDKIEVKPVLTPDRLEKRENGRRFKEDGEPSFTLNTQDQHGVQLDTSIRRLTEIECERLQGFADNWTEYGNYHGEVKKMSKTQRYKQLGNAVTVDIVELIANRLK